MADSTEQDAQDTPLAPGADAQDVTVDVTVEETADVMVAEATEVIEVIEAGEVIEQAEAVDEAPAQQSAADAMAEINAALDAEAAEAEFRRPAAELKAIVEALIFASPDPLTPKALIKLLDNEPKEDVLAALEELKQDYDRPGGLQMVEVAGGFQIVTRADLHEWVRRLFHERSSQKLSVQALESLAVIAYRQPITSMEVAEIRGVNASGVLNTLLERHLVKIVGRKQVVGRPFMYATTKEFLIRFGLKDLSDLPKVEDMAESLGIESSLLVERMPPEEQLPLSEPDHSGADEDATADIPDDFDSDIDGVDEEPGDPGSSVH